jgi:DNA-binding transcriptional regulator YhcF (GntR family)
MSRAFEMLADMELIEILRRRGYVVRHTSEARHPLSWNRRSPIPDGIDFRAEAVEKIREQIIAPLLHFEDRSVNGIEPGTSETVHSAFLRIL